jgi:hemerythrin superfamily protein
MPGHHPLTSLARSAPEPTILDNGARTGRGRHLSLAEEKPMSAIDMLEAQHREVEDLFAAFEEAAEGDKRELFLQIADKLAIHAAIEEKHFYPAARDKNTEDLLLEAAEEHLSVKRLIADLLKLDEEDDTFEAKVKVLQEQVEHHVEEEEGELFPKVEKLLDATMLEALEQEMTATQEDLLASGSPRDQVPGETGEAAPIG